MNVFTEAQFEAALATFVAQAQNLIDEHYKTNYPNYPENLKEVLSCDSGKRYVRIVRKDKAGTTGSVFCFVDMSNGDVLKAATFKAPAKSGPRGNIFTMTHASEAVTAYGAHYWRR